MARFTASIDDKLKEKLDLFAEEKGLNRSEALELMIGSFFERGEVNAAEPVDDAPAIVKASPNRVDELEKQLEHLQREFRSQASERFLRVEVLELTNRLSEMQGFLQEQHDYLRQLHEVVVSNAQASTELVPPSGDLEFYVLSSGPPGLPGEDEVGE